jgi:hypothetical protein
MLYLVPVVMRRGHTHSNVRMGCALLADDQHVVGCSEDGEWQPAEQILGATFNA